MTKDIKKDSNDKEETKVIPLTTREKQILETREFVFMLVDRVYPSLKNFPKIEHHGICKLIKHALFVCAGRLNLAAFVKSQRFHYLQLTQSAFEDARTYLKVSHRFKYIGTGFWRELDLLFTDGQERMTRCFKKQET